MGAAFFSELVVLGWLEVFQHNDVRGGLGGEQTPAARDQRPSARTSVVLHAPLGGIL
jgi:hypothetical protein